MRKLVVTIDGPAGAGKTTVLNILASQGYDVASDVAREIIRNRKAAGLSPRPAPEDFARQMYAGDVKNYQQASSTEGPTFFERGVVDAP